MFVISILTLCALTIFLLYKIEKFAHEEKADIRDYSLSYTVQTSQKKIKIYVALVFVSATAFILSVFFTITKKIFLMVRGEG